MNRCGRGCWGWSRLSQVSQWATNGQRKKEEAGCGSTDRINRHARTDRPASRGGEGSGGRDRARSALSCLGERQDREYRRRSEAEAVSSQAGRESIRFENPGMSGGLTAPKPPGRFRFASEPFGRFGKILPENSNYEARRRCLATSAMPMPLTSSAIDEGSGTGTFLIANPSKPSTGRIPSFTFATYVAIPVPVFTLNI